MMRKTPNLIYEQYQEVMQFVNFWSLHLTANSSAVFEMHCPASKQVVFQGSALRSVGGR